MDQRITSLSSLRNSYKAVGYRPFGLLGNNTKNSEIKLINQNLFVKLLMFPIFNNVKQPTKRNTC